MKSSDLTDAEIDDCSQAAYAARGHSGTLSASNLNGWRACCRAVVEGGNEWDHAIRERDAARAKAAAILAARAPKRETEVPRQYLGQVVSEGGSASGSGGEFVVLSLNNFTVPVWPRQVPITISVGTPQPSALDRLLTADVLRYQPIAVQRRIIDTMQAGREVPSALLWRMDLSREPGAAALRAEVIAGRMRARGWKAARE